MRERASVANIAVKKRMPNTCSESALCIESAALNTSKTQLFRAGFRHHLVTIFGNEISDSTEAISLLAIVIDDLRQRSNGGVAVSSCIVQENDVSASLLVFLD